MKRQKKIILPKDIIKPDYNGGSIVNLMSSIMKASGGKPEYPELRILRSEELKDYKNILLVILDGLGYEFLMKHGKNGFLAKNLRGKITSVFPATTAAAITTFATGTAPQQHAMTGWFMNVKELGGVVTALRYNPRIGGPTFSVVDINPKLFYNQKFFHEKIRRKPYSIQHFEIANSEYNSIAYKKYRTAEYINLKGFFEGIRQVSKMGGKKYIHAYWPDIDSLIHKYGNNDKIVQRHFKRLDKGFKKLSETLKDTIMIIVADHGLVDTGKKNTLLLKDHPKLQDSLSMPLSGDSRSSYCYVHPDKSIEFEKYVKKHFSNKCEMLTRQQAIASGIYGIGTPNKKFAERIGDYVLIWRKNYAFKDALLGYDEKIKKGNHGGASSTEMYVPLIIIKR